MTRIFLLAFPALLAACGTADHAALPHVSERDGRVRQTAPAIFSADRDRPHAAGPVGSGIRHEDGTVTETVTNLHGDLPQEAR